MSVVSFEFLGFLAALAVVYYVLPMRVRKWALLAGSAAFWLLCGWQGAAYLTAETLLIWGCARLMGRFSERRGVCRALLVGGMVTVFGAMVLMKALSQLQALPDGLLVPIGLSYFTFQSVGYLIDVYRGKVTPEKNYAKVLLFAGFFPQMTQGPITTWKQLMPQLDSPHRLSPNGFVSGVFLMAWGFFKKLVIADRLMPVVSVLVATAQELPGWLVLATAAMYAIVLYADFSGGIDITRGVARMFGIDMAENFRRPIFAMSLTEYWRRWHITLGAWMRDYVFYPLSLSKAFGRLSRWARTHIRGTGGKIFATSLATFIVYLIIGIWHGANFRYIAFGLWNGVLITASLLLERTFLRWKSALHINDKSAAWRVFMTLRTMLLVFIGRYFTRSPRLSCVLRFLKTTVLHPQPSQLLDGTLLSFGLAKTDFLVIALGLTVLLTLECLQERGVQIRAALEKKSGFVQWLAVTALLLAVLLLGVFRAGYIPSGFIYTQF